MRKLVLAAAVVATVAILPTAAPAASTFTGVVVAKSRDSLAVASKAGTITTVHTRVHVRIGARVRVSASSVRVVGLAHRVRLHAVVVRRAGSTTFLAGGHSLLAVHTGRQLASAVATLQPGTGAVINTTATITPNGQLNAGATQVVGQLSEIEVHAVVTAVGPGTITLSVNGQPLTIALPAGIQLPATLVGQSVTLKLKLNEAEPVAEDEDQAENDDQGDDNDDQGDDDGGGVGDGD
jgi:hypothetical protein